MPTDSDDDLFGDDMDVTDLLTALDRQPTKIVPPPLLSTPLNSFSPHTKAAAVRPSSTRATIQSDNEGESDLDALIEENIRDMQERSRALLNTNPDPDDVSNTLATSTPSSRRPAITPSLSLPATKPIAKTKPAAISSAIRHTTYSDDEEERDVYTDDEEHAPCSFADKKVAQFREDIQTLEAAVTAKMFGAFLEIDVTDAREQKIRFGNAECPIHLHPHSPRDVGIFSHNRSARSWTFSCRAHDAKQPGDPRGIKFASHGGFCTPIVYHRAPSAITATAIKKMHAKTKKANRDEERRVKAEDKAEKKAERDRERAEKRAANEAKAAAKKDKVNADGGTIAATTAADTESDGSQAMEGEEDDPATEAEPDDAVDLGGDDEEEEDADADLDDFVVSDDVVEMADDSSEEQAPRARKHKHPRSFTSERVPASTHKRRRCRALPRPPSSDEDGIHPDPFADAPNATEKSLDEDNVQKDTHNDDDLWAA